MQRAPWTATLAAAALIASAPGAFAQTAPPSAAQVDVEGAKKHLGAARDTLSQLTSMPEAAKLQGEARAQVSQLITNFNGLITTQSDWRAAYAKVDANLTSLLGPDPAATPAPDQPVGTAGTVAAPAAPAELDAAVRAKLTEFRTHLKAFEAAAGGSAPASASRAMPPANPTPATANPANPAKASASPATPAPAPEPAVPNADAQKELSAITMILDSAGSLPLTSAQIADLRKHIATLQVMLAKK